jgi:hypothetical protein
MNEPKELKTARDHLAKAESLLMSEDGLVHLREGLALLEAAIDSKLDARNESVARNLGQTYTSRIYEFIRQEIDENRRLPEPELEHLFAVLRAFDDACFDLPPESGSLKVGVVKRLIDLYYEGHPPADKQAVYEQLEELSRKRGGS